MTFDTAHFFEDLDTTRTTIDVTPRYFTTSHYPNGWTIVLDLQRPSVEGMQFNMIGECDEPFVELFGGELWDGGVVLLFECAEGWDYTIIVIDWTPVAKVMLYHPYNGGVIGMTFNAKLTIEPKEVAGQVDQWAV